MPAQLVDDHVVVREQSEASRIHNKGHYGRPLSGGALSLDLLEACYLSETDRLTVRQDGSELDWAALLVAASRRRPGFEIHYLAYRDLRERGYLVQTATPAEAAAGAHFRLWPRGTTRPGAPDAWLRAVTERAELVLADLWRFVDAAARHKAHARLCVVDEESDLTYYDLTTDAPKGPVPPKSIGEAADALLLADRVVVTDPDAARRLHEREFFGKPVAQRLQLSLVETLHLLNRGDVRVLEPGQRRALSAAAVRRRAREVEPLVDLRHRVYEDLKARGLIVKTGFKFGTHFRAYEDQPDEAHAPHLVQAVPADYTSPWEPVARAVRLSHSVRKRLHLASPEGDHVRYLAFGRFRP